MVMCVGWRGSAGVGGGGDEISCHNQQELPKTMPNENHLPYIEEEHIKLIILVQSMGQDFANKRTGKC